MNIYIWQTSKGNRRHIGSLSLNMHGKVTEDKLVSLRVGIVIVNTLISLTRPIKVTEDNVVSLKVGTVIVTTLVSLTRFDNATDNTVVSLTMFSHSGHTGPI